MDQNNEQKTQPQVSVPGKDQVNVNGLRLVTFTCNAPNIDEVTAAIQLDFTHWSEQNLDVDVINTETDIYPVVDDDGLDLYAVLWVWYQPRRLEAEVAALLMNVQQLVKLWRDNENLAASSFGKGQSPASRILDSMEWFQIISKQMKQVIEFTDRVFKW